MRTVTAFLAHVAGKHRRGTRADAAPRLALAGALLLSLLAAASARAEDDGADDPTERVGSLVLMDNGEQPMDMQAPPSQFFPLENDEMWARAVTRATSPAPSTTGGIFDVVQDLGDGFRSAKAFHSERYATGETTDELMMTLAAAEVVKNEKEVVLTDMRVTYFITHTSAAAVEKQTDAKDPQHDPKAGGKTKNDSKDKPKDASKDKPKEKPKDTKGTKDTKDKNNDSALDLGGLPPGGRVVILAPRAVIDLGTNEGRATGGVRVEVYAKPEPGQPETPQAILTTERLNWRSWQEAATGSKELVAHTCGGKGEADPLVKAQYRMPQQDGSVSTVFIEGYGLIYETGTYDRLNIVYDDDLRSAGLSKIARNRAVIHRGIRVDATGTTMKALIPFQSSGQPPKKGAVVEPPSRTLIGCRGPAIFDFAAVARVKKRVPEQDAAPAETALKPILLGRRFEFLNGVTLKKAPPEGVVLKPGEVAETADLACKHLCLQYPPASLPGTASMPEYAEAIGGVKMQGTTKPKTAPAGGASAGAAPVQPDPFDIGCDRVYYDCVNDNMFLVGRPENPAEVKYALAEARAQQLNYRSRSETFTMPSAGPKRLLLRGKPAPAGSKTASAGGMMSMSSADTVLTWRGMMSRQVIHRPVPNAPDILKEVMTLKDDVCIEQPQGGLKIRSARVQIIKPPEGDPEYLEGEGAVDAAMGNLRAKGDRFSVDIRSGQDGQPSRNRITVVGNRKRETKATLFQDGTALRADKFNIEMIGGTPNTLNAWGGTVAVFKKAPPAPFAAPTAAAAAPESAPPPSHGLIKSIDFNQGGDMTLQCDGDFTLEDGAETGVSPKVTIKKNVLIRQPGMQLLADEVRILLPSTAAPAPSSASAGATPASQLFSADIQSIECIGGVEVSTPSQVVHCDRLHHDVQAGTSDLRMDDPENDVRIYLSDDSGGTRFLSIAKRFKMDSKSGDFELGGMLLMLPFTGIKPVARDKASSPARLTRPSAPAPAPKTAVKPAEKPADDDTDKPAGRPAAKPKPRAKLKAPESAGKR